METLGRYEILSELGRGGCGVVYRALDPGIGRTVAIKTIRADGSDDSLRERFRREARSAGILSHPNIVTIYEFNDSGAVMFIAMECVDGQTLAQRMQEGPLPLDFALATLRAAANALDYAHAHNIVHRDVKPANFLLDEQGHVKMADFGIAKMLDNDVALTHTGMMIGTAQYMSPEQIAAKEITGRSDQFSLAVIAYEMLSGQKPFQGNSWASMIHSIISTEPVPLNHHREELGDAVTEALRKGLAKEPQDRYPSCKALADALEQSILGSTLEPTTQTRTMPKALVNPETAETMAMPSRQVSTPPTGTVTRSVDAPALTASGATPTSPTTTREIPPSVEPPAARKWAVPIVTAVVLVAGLGAWVGLRNTGSSGSQDEAQTPPASASSAPPSGGAAPATGSDLPSLVPLPGSVDSGPVGPGTASPSVSKSAAPPPVAKDRATRAEPSAGAAAAPSSAPKNARASVSPPEQPVSVPPVTSAPSVSAQPAPTAPVPNRAAEEAKRAAEEQAKRAADEQARRAAEEQAKKTADDQARRQAEERAKRQAEEQAKLQAEEQAKRQADEKAAADKAKSARAAELQAVSRALGEYTAAYGRKDANALQAVWPSIPKPVLEDVRNSFRYASEVKVDLRPLRDPEISGDTATVTCDRDLRQVVQKKVLEASTPVRIILNRRGAGWVIASIDAVKQ